MKRSIFGPLLLLLVIYGLVLAVSGPSHAGSWTVTVVSTPGSTTSNPSTFNATQIAFAQLIPNQTAGTVIAGIAGPTSGSLSSSSSTSYTGGQWVFKWTASSSTDWPAAYTITARTHESYSASAQNGSGTATITNGAGTVLAQVSLPTGNTAITNQPATTTTTDTSISGLVKTTQTTTSTFSQGSSSQWSYMFNNYVKATYQYAASYFTANWSSPNNTANPISITVTVPSESANASVSFSASSSSGYANAMGIFNSTCSGQ